MKVTEQIDALRALGVHPVDYLVVPRFLALLVSMPLFVAECVGLGIVASYFVGTKVLDISEAYYVHTMLNFTGLRDVKMALTKGPRFRRAHRLHQLPSGAECKGGRRRRRPRADGGGGDRFARHSHR
jgi:phospholipid/cholesterol/gamma-HCH transport system permease protein